MSQTLAVLTPAANRPITHKFCREYLSRQTRQPDVWLMSAPDCGLHLRENLLSLIEDLPAVDYIAIIEDDDWYHDEYLARICDWLDLAETVGEANSRHYNVRFRCHYTADHPHHASLHCTALRSTLLPDFKRAIESANRCNIDQRWWQQIVPKIGASVHLEQVQRYSLGIKGIPPGGYSAAHIFRKGIGDPDASQLREWIGDDADKYLGFHSAE